MGMFFSPASLPGAFIRITTNDHRRSKHRRVAPGTKPPPIRVSLGLGAGLLGLMAMIGLASSFSPSPPQVEAAAEVRDAIPFRNVNGGLFVYANLGGVPHNMQLDTGAGSSTVTLPVARVLVARRQATVMPGFLPFGMADGSVSGAQNNRRPHGDRSGGMCCMTCEWS